MTDHSDAHHQVENLRSQSTAHGPSARRRALVRGAFAAVPTVLTLHSGAALARSSNLIGTIDVPKQDESAFCLETTGLTTVPDTNPPMYDLGAQPTANVREYSHTRQYYSDYSCTVKAYPGDMCRNGGSYWYKKSDGTKVKVQFPTGGGLVSATALSSFAGTNVNITQL